MEQIPKNLYQISLEAHNEVKEIHKNDLYGKDKPYFEYHIKNVCDRVVEQAIKDKLNPLTIHKLFILSLYHDAHEDHGYCLDKFEQKYGTELKDALIAISYNKGNETRQKYYERVAVNELAKYVKRHDAMENAYNSKLEGNTSREKYYLHAVSLFQETTLT